MKFVMDAGCGSGYGDSILLNSCSRVLGIDRSPEAIEYASWASEKTDMSRVEYIVADLANLPMERLLSVDAFDGVVCIEAIEHMRTEEQNNFLASIKKILKPEDGKFIVTTPVRNIIFGSLKTPYHEAEFSRK